MLLIIAIVGTTVAPWQLFFQQSYVIDKRITPRFMTYEQVDLWIGIALVVVGAAAHVRVLCRGLRRDRRASGTSPTRRAWRRAWAPMLGTAGRVTSSPSRCSTPASSAPRPSGSSTAYADERRASGSSTHCTAR